MVMSESLPRSTLNLFIFAKLLKIQSDFLVQKVVKFVIEQRIFTV